MTPTIGRIVLAKRAGSFGGVVAPAIVTNVWSHLQKAVHDPEVGTTYIETDIVNVQAFVEFQSPETHTSISLVDSEEEADNLIKFGNEYIVAFWPPKV